MPNNELTTKTDDGTLRYVLLLVLGAFLAICTLIFPTVNAVYIIGPWIYLPCFLYVSRSMTRPLHYILWAVFWYGSLMVRYWGILLPMGAGISMLMQFIAAAVYSIPFLLDRFAYKKNVRIVSLLIFPFAFAAIDYIVELMRLGSLFSLAQTQFDNKLLLQLAAVLGCKGIVFILGLSASFIVYYRKNVKVLGICLAALLVIHICGLARFNINRPLIDASDKIVIGWSGGPITDDSFFRDESEGDLDGNTACLQRTMDEASEKGVHLLCFPEESFYLHKEYYDSFIKQAQEMAAEYGMILLLPIESWDPENEDALGINQCLLIDAEGNILQDYRKTMLVPAVETNDYEVGDGKLPSVDVSIGDKDLTISYAICFDGDFASYVHTMSDETDLFIDVSWDWDEVEDLHYRIIGLRAVENGVTVLKPTICGYTTVTDYIGRILSKTHSDDTGYEGVNLVELPIAKCSTVYHRIGNLIDYFYLIGLAVLILIIVLQEGKNGKQKAVNTVWRI